ncbi:hypothetical protein D3C80_1077300 [compost metagenome]
MADKLGHLDLSHRVLVHSLSPIGYGLTALAQFREYLSVDACSDTVFQLPPRQTSLQSIVLQA